MQKTTKWELAAYGLVVLAIISLGISPFFSLLILAGAGICIVVGDDIDREVKRGLKELEDLANKREGKDEH